MRSIKVPKTVKENVGEAIERLKEATRLLKESECEWGLVKYDLAHFRNQIEGILSCDNGEAGMEPFHGRLEVKE